MKFRDTTGLMLGHFSPFQCALKGISVAAVHEAVLVILVTEASSV